MTAALIVSDHVRAWFAGRSPVVIARRSTLRQWERNGFELGRDYERGQRSDCPPKLNERPPQNSAEGVLLGASTVIPRSQEPPSPGNAIVSPHLPPATTRRGCCR
jgi:hypothetical protein